jgi:hypothetical protein
MANFSPPFLRRRRGLLGCAQDTCYNNSWPCALFAHVSRNHIVTKTDVEDEIERFRQLVIASRNSSTVESQSQRCVDRLNKCYRENRRLFSVEDVRWLNVLRGYLGVRLDSHKSAREHTRQSKRKGDNLDHCWRCETPIDERFNEFCVTCSNSSYQWRVCPVCQACGCQSSGRLLV